MLIRNSIVYINGQPSYLPPKSQIYYYVETNGQPLDESVLKEEYDVDMNNNEEFQSTIRRTHSHAAYQ